jgi:hypothetical protein
MHTEPKRELATDTHQLAKKKIRREGIELDDWFEARNEAGRNKQLEEEQREQEAYQRQIRQRQEQAAVEERRRFERKWLSYAVEHQVWEAGPDDYAVVIRPEVMADPTYAEEARAESIEGTVVLSAVVGRRPN